MQCDGAEFHTVKPLQHSGFHAQDRAELFNAFHIPASLMSCSTLSCRNRRDCICRLLMARMRHSQNIRIIQNPPTISQPALSISNSTLFSFCPQQHATNIPATNKNGVAPCHITQQSIKMGITMITLGRLIQNLT